MAPQNVNLIFMAEEQNKYYFILNDLKEKIRLSRQKAAIAVNNELLLVYWEIGNAILLQQTEEGWGTKVIDRLTLDLKTEFPEMKGLSIRNLKYMRSFAEAYPKFMQQSAAQSQVSENQHFMIVQQPAAQLPWGHHQLLLDKLKSANEREFYIRKAVENGWSRSILVHQIESHLHLREGNAITNFKSTLPKVQSDLARETIKSPYLFDFLSLGEDMQERELENALIRHLKKFMLELGRGFAYVGNQFNLNVKGDDYFLDLLFYNCNMHCYVVFELKVGEFKPEYAGKLNFYVNTINQKIKKEGDNATIGVLLCKTPNDTVIEYSLKGIDTPIGVADYEFTKALPKQLKGEMPSIEELEMQIEKETLGFKENLSAIDTRLLGIKEKLRAIKAEEIQTPATYPLLVKIYEEGLRPLYEELINRLGELSEEFHRCDFGWSAINLNTNSIEQLDTLWSKEENLNKIKELSFYYNFIGFKKGGTENYTEYLNLKFEIQDYWYGFTFANNNNQCFLKKLYHQPITKEDRQLIVDLMMSKVLDRIEWIIQKIKN